MNGEVWSGRYQVEHMLGAGGFSQVFLAHDLRIPGRKVAIKRMDVTQLAPAHRQWAAEQFRREAELLALLNHPSIVAVSDFFSEEEHHFLVMDYIEGRTLAVELHRLQRLSIEQASTYFVQLTNVLDYLHTWVDPRTLRQTPIVFRDLKPANVMVTPSGRVQLIDFGIARFFQTGKLTDTHIVGTPGYASPEQYGQGQTDARSDIYSLGVITYQMLTGYNPVPTPFNLPPIQQINAHVPGHMAQAITQAIELKPEARFGNVTAFRQAFLSQPYIAPPSATPVPPTTRPWTAISAVVAFVLVVAFGLVTWAIVQSPLMAGPSAEVAGTGSTGTAPLTSTPTPEAGVPNVADAPDVVEPTAVVSTTVVSTTVVSTAVVPTEVLPSKTPSATPTDMPSPTLTPLPGVVVQEAIAFTRRDRDTNGDGAIDWDDNAVLAVANGDGSAVQRLTDANEMRVFHSSWSPVGLEIVFAGRREGETDMELFVIERTGANMRSLTENGVTDGAPDWSPDGEWIVFHSDESGSNELWLIRPDGTDRQQLTDTNQNLRFPAWSPDGSQIAFVLGSGSNLRVGLIEADGTGLTSLTEPNASEPEPAWSPDGRFLVYASNDDEAFIYRYELATENNLPLFRTNSASPTWSPDGLFVLVSSWQAGRPQLWRIGWDGTGVVRWVIGDGIDTQADWWGN